MQAKVTFRPFLYSQLLPETIFTTSIGKLEEIFENWENSQCVQSLLHGLVGEVTAYVTGR
jgi:hypothetical protein